MLEFKPEGDVVQLKGEIYGLTAGDHNVRILEVDTCDLKQAYGNEPPDPSADEAHLQDLGQLAANDADGCAEIDTPGMRVALSGEKSIIGRAVVIYAGKEDLNYQEVSSADARIACGVITVD